MEKVSKWFKRSMHLSLALLLVAVLGIGLTVAYFTDVEGALNRVLVGEINVTTQEDIDGLTKNDIAIVANGTSEAYVRMRVDIPTVTYSYLNGETLKTDGQALITIGSEKLTAAQWAKKTELTAVITHGDETTSDAVWEKKEDGFWYLSTTLKQGDSAKIIDSITYPGLWDKENKCLVSPLPAGLTEDMLTIIITSEAVQKMDEASTAYEAFQKVGSSVE